ncbi:MAG: hypothetical protein H7Z16_10790 [Pyrinomonadaceae bacterium]|nr:hypothetical protein [Pyrinomonadaceae bacterium]
MSRLRILNSHRAVRIAALAILLGYSIPCSAWERSVAVNPQVNTRNEDADGTLAEIKDKHRVALLITRNSVVHVSGSDGSIVREALAAEIGKSLRYRLAYGVISGKLNQYMRKHRSMRPVQEIAQADFIVYFRLVEYRRVLNGVYPYGELYVIVNQQPGETLPARVIWKTKKLMFAEDAVKNLVKDLKRVREER